MQTVPALTRRVRAWPSSRGGTADLVEGSLLQGNLKALSFRHHAQHVTGVPCMMMPMQYGREVAAGSQPWRPLRAVPFPSAPLP